MALLLATSGGWLSGNTANAAVERGDVVPVVPARLLETRSGETTIDGRFQGQGARRAGSVLELQVTGRGGVPAAS